MQNSFADPTFDTIRKSTTIEINSSILTYSATNDFNEMSESIDKVIPESERKKPEPLTITRETKVIVSVPQKNNYYIIAGSFKEKANAEKYYRTLYEAGYSNTLYLGKIKGFYTIAVYSTPMKDSALKQLEIQKKQLKSVLWIYYHK